MGPAALRFFHSLARKNLTKNQGSGIITIPNRMTSESEASAMIQTIVDNGLPLEKFDQFIRSEDDILKYLNIIKNANKQRVIPADSPEGRQITEQLFGKKGEVVDMTGKKIDTRKGIMGGKSVEELMDSGQVTKGTSGITKSKKVQDREMFQAANERLTSDVDSIIKNIKSMEPITAMKEANSVIGRKGKYKNLTSEESKKILQDTEDHIFQRDPDNLYDPDPEDFAKGGRAGLKDGNPPVITIDDKIDEMISFYKDYLKKGGKMDFKTFSKQYVPENFASGGRAGFAGGGSDASTTSYSKSYDKQHGTNTASRANKSVDRRQAAGQRDADNTNRRMEANRQAGLSEIFAPKETIREKIENSRFNNPITRGLFKAGLYTLNPSLGVLDARQAMQLKNAYDLAVTGSLPNTDTEETLDGIGGLTSNLITDQQAKEIDKASKTANLMNDTGKLTDIEKNTIFENAKPFDDKGSSGVFGIGGRDAEPMTREEFDNYVQEKGYATGGRAGFMAGGMGRRAFLKLMGGTGATIGAAKSGIFSGFGKGAGKEVAKEVVKQSAGTPPPYFFKLAEKIKMLGDDATATTDRTIAKTLKSKDGKSTYLLEEDVTSGDTIIKKINKEGDEMITDVEIMELKKGEVVKGKDGKAMKTPDEYEEVTEANARIEGDVFNDPYYSDGIEIDDILREVDDIPVPKASGGIARMLGE